MMITSHTTTDTYSNGTLIEGAESPLDVLSRAATMVQQESEQSERNNKSSLKVTTNKWKRDRRRLPEYSRKSDPKVPETLGAEPSSPESCLPSKSSLPAHLNGMHSTTNGSDGPLDMTVKQRGLPPSYDQTINNPTFRSSYRPPPPPVTTSTDVSKVNPVPKRDELPSGISMCDPVIEEHFRRSLGADYHLLFQNNNKEKEPEPEITKEEAAKANIIEMMEDTAVSVDDHFAKALGETWAKLNKKEEIKTASENNLVTIKN